MTFANSQKKRSVYMPQLDGLRAIAVFAVLVHHFLPESFFLNSFVLVGPLGVRFFFVLSGFLITGILLTYKQKAQSQSETKEIIANFYARRVIRLFPAYYLLLFASLAVGYRVIKESFGWHFFYLSNFYFSFAEADNADPLGLLSHLWSLAVGEQFYIVWPVVVMLLPTRYLSKVLIGGIAASVLSRFIVSATGFGGPLAVYFLPTSCLDALCLGGLLAYVTAAQYSFSRFKKPFLRFCILFGIPLFVWTHLFAASSKHLLADLLTPSIAESLYLALTPLSASLFFVWIVNEGSKGFRGYLGRFLQSRPMLYLGKTSYGIYLYHLLAIYLIRQASFLLDIPSPSSWFAYLILFLASSLFTVLIAAVSWSIIERPINELKNKFPYLKRTQTDRAISCAELSSIGQTSIPVRLDSPLIVNSLSKRFSSYRTDKPVTFMQAALAGFRGLKSVEDFWALKNVSFDVSAGEMLGVLGHNGAGKSTLLQLLGSVSFPTKGRIYKRGRVGALLDLGAGFHGDLTGRENIFVTAIVAGLSRREVASRFDVIVEFAELKRFVDNPVRTYSTGMKMRLAFAIAVHTNPEILLVDEFLSVGDLAFQSKCLNRISEMKKNGCAIVLVSHDVGQIEQLCDRALWLKRGTVMAYGEPNVVVGQYTMEMRTQTQQRTPARPSQITRLGTELKVNENRFGSLEAEITDVIIHPSSQLASGDRLHVEIRYLSCRAIERPIFGVDITTVEGETCFSTNTASTTLEGFCIDSCGSIYLQLDRLDLAGGVYFVDVGIYEANWEYAYDFHWHVYPITVRSTVSQQGLLNPPLEWTAHVPLAIANKRLS